MNIHSSLSGTEIAVIGISCRFPEANNYFEFWNNLKSGRESIFFLSEEELKRLAIDSAILNNSKYVRTKGAPINNKDQFDHAFFEYSKKEASVMDPQMRFMHECVWESLEDAGYDTATFKGRVGLIAGLSSNYAWLRGIEHNEDAKNLGFFHTSTLVDKEFSILNVAYRLNLKGPCYSLFTTCSTSLVAIHQACRSLLMGESEIMVAGGVSFSTDILKGYIHQEGMILSSDGHCRAFDKESSGTVKGEGAGFIVLKRLKNAIQDRDNIYAVIKGSAINNDGDRKVGFFAPSVEGQKEVIKTALKIAKVDPETISYVEAHGTATSIGDPIEISGLTQAFSTNKRQFCAIGSVKTNIGHLDAAAGVAGFIKTVLCVRNKTLVPSLNYSEPNPSINFSDTPFQVVTKTIQWNGDVLRAGVSSFGIGGTNGHVILENYEDLQLESSAKPELLVISARTESALTNIKRNLNSFVLNRPVNQQNLAYTLQVGRKHFFERDFTIIDTNNTGSLFPLIKTDSTVYNSAILLLSDFNLPALEKLLELVQLNNNLKRIYENVCELIKENHNYKIDDFFKVLSFEKIELLQGFIYQYTIVEFISKLSALPDRIFVSGLGELTMFCLNGVLSISEAVELIVKNESTESALSSFHEKNHEFVSSSSIKHPFQRLSLLDVTSQLLSGNDPVDDGHVLFVLLGEYDLKRAQQTLSFSGAAATINFTNILTYIGVLWKSGKTIDFEYFNENTNSRRISIPTYPFESVKILTPTRLKALSENSGHQNNLFYKLSWKKEQFHTRTNQHSEEMVSIVLTTDTSFEQKLIKELLGSDKQVHLLDWDERSSEIIVACINKIKADNLKVIFLLGFESQASCSRDTIDIELDAFFFSILDLLRHFGQSEKNVYIDFVTNKSFDITGLETANIALSTITAVAKIIPLESPNIHCRIIDLNTDYFNQSSQKVFYEVVHSTYNEKILAIRNDTLWFRMLQPHVLNESYKQFSYIKENGLYLITGGFGGMGYIIAKNLLEQTSASVILVGRRSETEIQNSKADEYNYLNNFEARICYYSLDISDFTELNKLSQIISKNHGNISGIFHTAGIADFGGIIQRRTNESIKEVLRPKIHGILNLYELFNYASLDFFTLFSSVGNILYKDKVGQIAYNAANEFLDAFCNVSPKVISINWCDWKERGMTVESIKRKVTDKRGDEIIQQLNALSDEEGIEVLNLILNNYIQNVIVFKSNLLAMTSENNLHQLAENKSATSILFTFDYVRQRMKDFFVNTFSMTFDYESDFFDLGADSLQIINALPKINGIFSTTLTINDFYTNPSINELSNAIIENKKRGIHNKIEKIAVKLGNGQKIMFAFPPAIGLGFLAYNTMSELMPDYTIYAFNFLTDSGRINKYITFINDIIGNTTCVFLGYSAGGTLAYEVAKRMERNKITDLIVLDTYIYRLRFARDKKERKLLQIFFEEYRQIYGKEILDNIAPLMTRFYFYVNNLVSDGAIEASIHLIKARDRAMQESENKHYLEVTGVKQKYKSWEELTLGNYKEYNGYGCHNEMLNTVNYKFNVNIILEVLKSNG